MTFSAPVLPHNRPHRQSRIAHNRHLLVTPSEATANIETVLATATDDEWADGLAWYSSAHDIAETVGRLLWPRARNRSVATVKGAAIVAALSPQTSWDENVVRALAFARGEEVGGLQDGLTKASRIVDGESPNLVLGGRKVRSFWHNIVGNGHAVTVDRHAAAIVVGRPLTDASVKCLERIGCYAQIAAAYRSVARKHGIQPCQLQAITWLAWRREHAWDRAWVEGEF